MSSSPLVALRAIARGGWQRVKDAGGILRDAIDDRILAPKLAQLRASPAFAAMPRQRILVAGVQTVRRPGSIARIFAEMASERHELTLAVKDVGGLGKLDNINMLVAQHDLEAFDWLWMIDDDVALPSGFTDIFVMLCAAEGYQFAQPAHRAYSYSGHRITERQTGLLTHATNFVEIGPVTAFHRSVFDVVLPFPSLRYGWGLDVLWSWQVAANGWRMGVVDAAALRHTSPVAATYDWQAARAECEDFLRANGVEPEGALVQRMVRRVRRVAELGAPAVSAPAR